MVEHSEREHAIFGGSTAARRLQCPGSVAEAEIPAGKPSKSAAEGTEAHEVAEVALNDYLRHKKLGTDPEENLSAIIQAHPESMITYVRDYVQCVWNDVLLCSITNKRFGVETYFDYDSTIDAGGTIDFWAVYINDKGLRTGVVLDFKYGVITVSEKKNAQLAFYACSLRRAVRAFGKDLDIIRTGIYQPRLPDEEPFRETTLSTKQLDIWEKKFDTTAHKIFVEHSTKLKAGPECRYCRRMPICKEYAKQIHNKTDLALVDTKKIVLPTIPSLTDKQVCGLALYGDLLIDYVKAAKAYCINRYLNGKPVPGTKVVEGRGRRGWLENPIAIGKELKAMGVAKPWQYKLKGITDIEKILGKGKVDKFVKPAKATAILTSESDERPGVTNVVNLLMTENEDFED